MIGESLIEIDLQMIAGQIRSIYFVSNDLV